MHTRQVLVSYFNSTKYSQTVKKVGKE